VTVREVNASDLPQVIDLVRDVLAEFGLRFGEGSRTDEEVTHLPASYVEQGGSFWVAVDATGVVVGTCGVFPVGEATFELRKMYLRPEARGTGAGQLLFDTCLGFVRSGGAKRLVLDTMHDMKRAIAFYERNGFVRDDAQMRAARCSRGYTRML
jgi:putative acetyltransferase